MDTVSLIVVGVIGAAAGYAVSIYNKLVKNRTMSEEGFSGIDVQLKRRYDLIPNLVETVKGYAAHEAGTLEKVTEWRARAQGATNLDDRFKAEAGLSQALATVFAVSESYPDLKANANFVDLQNKLTEIEDQIQLARRYYNGTARDLNMMIDQFPSNIIANMFHFEKKPFFEIENEAERANVKVGF
jgi:LemA protein